VSGCFGVDPCSHRGVRPTCRHGFFTRGVYSHLEQSHFDGLRFPCCGSCLTRSNGEVQKTAMSSLGHMAKCWIPKIFLTNPNTEPSTSSHSM
jgi:hypothetical protein